MDKTEYKKIINFLDKGQIDELRKYLDDRMDLKELKKVKKVLMDLINSDYYNEYPSYYQRKNHDEKVKKVYNGIFEKTESGIIVLHQNSNLFQIYNKEVLNPNLEQLLEYNREYYNQHHDIKRETMLDKIQTGLADLDKRYKKKAYFFDLTDDDRYVEVSDRYEKASALIPNRYYKMAHQLIGDETDEYLDSKGSGVYIKSNYGRALIMRMDVKTK